MAGRRRFERVAEAFVEVGFPISVGVVQPCQLVAAQYKNAVLIDDQALGLAQSGSKPSPAGSLGRMRESGYVPDVAMHCAH